MGLTIHHHLVPNLRVYGALSRLLHTSSYRGANVHKWNGFSDVNLGNFLFFHEVLFRQTSVSIYCLINFLFKSNLCTKMCSPVGRYQHLGVLWDVTDIWESCGMLPTFGSPVGCYRHLGVL